MTREELDEFFDNCGSIACANKQERFDVLSALYDAGYDLNHASVNHLNTPIEEDDLEFPNIGIGYDGQICGYARSRDESIPAYDFLLNICFDNEQPQECFDTIITGVI